MEGMLQLAFLPDAFGCLIYAFKNLLALLQKTLPLRRKGYPPPKTVKQTGPKFLFQAQELLVQRGLCKEQFFSCMGDIAFLGYF